jgi:uncharacterized protein
MNIHPAFRFLGLALWVLLAACSTDDPKTVLRPSTEDPKDKVDEPGELIVDSPQETGRELGDAIAAFERGDYPAAISLFRLLAEQGDATAQFRLGVMCVKGQGTSRSYTEAVKWFRMAADQGVAYAQFNLGVMYASGYGVAQNYIEAHKWFNLAAACFPESEAGNRQLAIELRDEIAAQMNSSQLAQAERLAREWQPK